MAINNSDGLNLILTPTINITPKTVVDLNEKIASLIKQLKTDINLNITINQGQIKQQVEQQVSQIKNAFASASKVNIGGNPYVGQNFSKQEFEKRAEEIKSQMSKIGQLTKVDIQLDPDGNFKRGIIAYKNEIGQLVQEVYKLQKVKIDTGNKGKLQEVDTFKFMGSKVSEDQGKMKQALESTQMSAVRLDTELKKLKENMSSGKVLSERSSISYFTQEIEKWLVENDKLRQSNSLMSNELKIQSAERLSALKLEILELKNKEQIVDKSRKASTTSGNKIEDFRGSVTSTQSKYLNPSLGLTSQANVAQLEVAANKITSILDRITNSGKNMSEKQEREVRKLIDAYNEQYNTLKKIETAKTGTSNFLQTKTNTLSGIKEGFSGALGVRDEHNLSTLKLKYQEIITEVQRLQQAETILNGQQKSHLSQRIIDLKTLASNYSQLERTAEKGFNFKQYNRVDEAVGYQKITTASEAYNKSLLAGHKLLSASVSETDRYIKVSQQLQQGNWMKTVGVYVDKTNGQMHQFNKTVKDNLADTITWEKALTTAAKRMAQWATSGALVFGAIREIKAVVQYTIDMDTALTELNKVFDVTASQMMVLKNSAIQMGQELGKSSVQVMKGMAEFARYYKNINDLTEMTRVATTASNISTLTTTTAAKTLTSAMITYKLGVKDAMGVLDQWNELQNIYKVTAEDLANSISTVGAASKQAGVSIQELEGYTTALVAALNITGSEAGTALKAIISRVYRIGVDGADDAGKTEERLKAVGVAVRKADGTFRDFGSILSDTKEKFASLNNTEQMAIAQQAAG